MPEELIRKVGHGIGDLDLAVVIKVECILAGCLCPGELMQQIEDGIGNVHSSITVRIATQENYPGGGAIVSDPVAIAVNLLGIEDVWTVVAKVSTTIPIGVKTRYAERGDGAEIEAVQNLVVVVEWRRHRGAEGVGIGAFKVNDAPAFLIEERVRRGIVKGIRARGVVMRYHLDGAFPGPFWGWRLGNPHLAEKAVAPRLREDHDPVVAVLVPMHRCTMQANVVTRFKISQTERRIRARNVPVPH